MIPRDSYIQKIRPFIGKDIVKVLTGIRRSGKSSLLELLRLELIDNGEDQSQFLTINFEDLAYQELSVSEINETIKAFCSKNPKQSYIFLDEVQEITGWEKLVNSLRVTTNADIYITGSNSNLLSGELATHLAGRYIEVPVVPLSYKEVNDWNRQISSTPLHPDELFQRYLRLGGFPFIYASELDDRAALSYLLDIYQSIMLKDIVARYGVRDIDLLNRVFLYFFANLAQVFSGNSVANFLKNGKRSISSETLYNYIAYAQEACLIYLVPRYDIQGKRSLSFQEKLFLADTGIRQAVFGYNERDITQVLENVVFLDLLRRGYTVNIGKVEENEVDFVAVRAAERMYLQVSYLLADESTVEREFSVLERINDNFPKIVLSLDKFDRSRNGIRHQNIIDFLLEL
jgi:Predicted ATPase (AAA+ superfamily)